LKGLHESYEDWLVTGRFGRPPAPVLILDADQGIDSMLQTYQQFEVRGQIAFDFIMDSYP
jgi:hypothetical protein